jgi:hypothetical protein
MGRLITPPLRLKYFYFSSVPRVYVERGIGGKYISDTTAVSKTTEARVTLKSYSFTAGGKTNKARIRVYGYCTLNPESAVMYVNVNGVDIASVTGLPSSEALILDVYADLEPNTAVTISIDVASSTAGVSVTVYITKVYIIAGFGLTSTSNVDILTVALDPRYDTYILRVRGNISYRVGIRWWAKGNRKTTATANLFSTLPNETLGYSNLGAGDDGDKEVFLRIGTGDIASEFTIRGYVGAEGDIIIITSLYCQITLRGEHIVTIRERGVMYVTTEAGSITGDTTRVIIDVNIHGWLRWATSSGTGAEILFNAVVPVWDISDYGVKILLSGDTDGRAMVRWININILGE